MRTFNKWKSLSLIQLFLSFCSIGIFYILHTLTPSLVLYGGNSGSNQSASNEKILLRKKYDSCLAANVHMKSHSWLRGVARLVADLSPSPLWAPTLCLKALLWLLLWWLQWCSPPALGGHSNHLQQPVAEDGLPFVGWQPAWLRGITATLRHLSYCQNSTVYWFVITVVSHGAWVSSCDTSFGPFQLQLHLKMSERGSSELGSNLRLVGVEHL